jgi:gluconolactonase
LDAVKPQEECVPVAEELAVDLANAALLIQDLQNDVVSDGGAFASDESLQHARDQDVVAKAAALAEACRGAGLPIIHLWFRVDEGARALKQNAPIFAGIKGGNAFVRGSWGAEPAPGLEPREGDYVVEKMRMSGWQDTQLEALLSGLGVDTIIVAGAWTNMSVEHTARTGADKGYNVVLAEDCCSSMNADWHRVAVSYALQNVATVTSADVVKHALNDGR